MPSPSYDNTSATIAALFNDSSNYNNPFRTTDLYSETNINLLGIGHWVNDSTSGFQHWESVSNSGGECAVSLDDLK
jgi:hypothetical protein